MSSGDGPWELRAQVPPGWIELAAHDNDDAAESAFAELVEPYREHLTADQYRQAVETFRLLRAMAVRGGFQLCGALLTAWDEAEATVPTVWLYGLRAFGLAERTELNPVALLERVFRASVASAGDLPEDFETVDGRVGTALLTTVQPDAAAAALGGLPEVASGPMGVCVAAVPLPGLPDAAALVFGAAPNVEQRGAMSVIASILAHSVHVVGPGVPEVQLVDASLEEALAAPKGERDE